MPDTQIDTTALTNAAYGGGGQNKIVRLSDGTIISIVPNGTNADLFYSKDNGSTFTLITSLSSVIGYQVSLARSPLDALYVCWNEGNDAYNAAPGTGRGLVVKRGIPNSTKTNFSFGSDVPVPSNDYVAAIGTQDQSDMRVPAMVIVPVTWNVQPNTQEDCFIVSNEAQGPTAGISEIIGERIRFNVATNAVITKQTGFFLGDITDTFYQANPVIDFFHQVGNQYVTQSNTPHLMAAWTNNAAGTTEKQGIWFNRIVFNSGSWNSGAHNSVVQLDTRYAWNSAIAGYFDGNRFVVAYAPDNDNTNIKIAQRDAANTGTTYISPPALGDGPINAIAATYDANQNIYLFAVGDTSDDLKWIKYDRGAGTWGSWAVLHAGTVTALNVSVSRGALFNTLDVAFLDGTSFRYVSASTTNQNPYAPTLDDKANFDATTTQVFTAHFEDPDEPAGDTQSAHRLVITREIAGTVAYDSGKVTSSAETFSVPGGTLTNALSYLWTAYTWDAADAPSPAATQKRFVAAAAPTISISSPVNASSISVNRITVLLSYSDPAGRPINALQVLLKDNLGNTLVDTGKISGSSLSIPIDWTLLNGQSYQVQAYAWNDALIKSAIASSVFTTAFIMPEEPTISGAPDPDNGRIIISYTNPDLVFSDPPVTYNSLFRRKSTQANWVRIATLLPPNGPVFYDYQVASGQQYEYKIVAYADTNGTSNESVIAYVTVNLRGVWLHDITDITSIYRFKWDGHGRSYGVGRERSMATYAGRQYPSVEFGENLSERIQSVLKLENADIPHLLDLSTRPSLICYRDRRGRFIIGNLEADLLDDAYEDGANTAITMTKIHFIEGV
jgi:hypothetical protein